ncbi:MAG TPA: hypothetical protein VK806_09475 [Bacteroidia bacterium]|nr:hypothetical protein [Bacteroidia bacterium]
MRKNILALLLSSFALLSFTSIKVEEIPTARTILDGLFKSVENAQTLAYELDYSERKADGKYRKDSSNIKFQKTPFRVYMKMSTGAEVLWGPDMNDGDALIHPDAFPYINLNLSTTGSIMRKNQHHGIEATGFAYFGSILKNVETKAGKAFDSRFLYLGEITFNGFHCYNLVVLSTSFKYEPYTVLKGENLLTIAKKLFVNDYMIQIHNNLSSFSDVKAGQVIMVPTDYAQELTLYIDKTTMLPVLIKVVDDKGLFEEYHFRKLKVNPAFSANEFSKTFKDYHF